MKKLHNQWNVVMLIKNGFFSDVSVSKGFPPDSVVKNPPANAWHKGVVSWIPGSGRFPGEWNGNPLQYSCLGNSTDREAWWATVLGVNNNNSQFSDYTVISYLIHWSRVCCSISINLWVFQFSITDL